MLPIVAAPLVIKNFCSLFETIFERPEQQNNFESIITALCVSKNKTIAGLHQQLFTGVTYNSLHHFMSESPWSVEKLQEQRIKYVKERIGKIKNYDSPLRFSIDECSVEQAKIHNGSLVTQDGKISECVSMPVDNADEECEPQKRKTIVQDSRELSTNNRQLKLRDKLDGLTIVAIDSTFVHHTSEDIYGVYWYWNYAKRCYVKAQKLVLSALVTSTKLVPLGWKLYHRGFLEEQKLYLEAMKPASDVEQAIFDDYNELVKIYEQNQEEHKTQNELAAELVDECERSGLCVDVYVIDGGFADPELMKQIDMHQKAWITKLAKSRLVQTKKGGFETIESFAKSLPKDWFKEIEVQTRHGEERKYYVFSKCVQVKGWDKLRVVISYDNKELEGEPIYLITNKTNWVQPEKIVQPYLRRDPIEHLIRDEKQELGLESSQQRKEDGVRKHWELSFVAHTFLELGFEVPDLPGVPSVRLETLGQKRRVISGAILYGLLNCVEQMVLEGADLKEFFKQIMTRRLNRLAT